MIEPTSQKTKTTNQPNQIHPNRRSTCLGSSPSRHPMRHAALTAITTAPTSTNRSFERQYPAWAWQTGSWTAIRLVNRRAAKINTTGLTSISSQVQRGNQENLLRTRVEAGSPQMMQTSGKRPLMHSYFDNRTLDMEFAAQPSRAEPSLAAPAVQIVIRLAFIVIVVVAPVPAPRGREFGLVVVVVADIAVPDAPVALVRTPNPVRLQCGDEVLADARQAENPARNLDGPHAAGREDRREDHPGEKQDEAAAAQPSGHLVLLCRRLTVEVD